MLLLRTVYLVKPPHVLRRSTKATPMKPSTFRMRLGFCWPQIQLSKVGTRGTSGETNHCDRGEEGNDWSETHLGGSDLLHVQSIVQQLRGGEMLLHKVLQDFNSHVWVVDLKTDTATLHKTTTRLSRTTTTSFSEQL